eukprot:Skav230503  [mRNA]  locus=scaffold2083:112522:113661:+ [translate_table: standard]
MQKQVGWGLDLVLECQATGSSPPSSAGGATKVTIGSSLDSHVKCVDAPARNVHCDSTAKQLGRSGKYPDTFHIYHEGNRNLGKTWGALRLRRQAISI